MSADVSFLNRPAVAAVLLLLFLSGPAVAQPVPKPEPVSKRFIGELIHPNNPRILGNIHFSPDGERVIAGDYPGGLVAVWDVASRKCLFTVDAGAGGRGSSEYVEVSPDWKKFYVWRTSRKHEWIEVDGNKELRWEHDGDVRTFDLSDGKLLKTYRHTPPRGIHGMRLSPDGSRFITYDEASGSTRLARGSLSLWNVKTGEYQLLPKGLEYHGQFDPTSRLYLDVKYKRGQSGGYVSEIGLIDLGTMREKWSEPVQQDRVWVSLGRFSPDGKTIVACYRAFEKEGKWDKWKSWIKWHDGTTGKESFSMPIDDGEASAFEFSPDGHTLVTRSFFAEPKKIRLFNVAERRLTTTFTLDKPPEKFGQHVRGLAFSPDSRWLVVAHQLLPLEHDDTITPLVVQQPRILLIDVAAAKIRETMISPPGYASSIAFSRDGRQMATSGYGKVMLWDMSDLLKR